MTNREAIERIRIHKMIHKLNEPRAVYITEALNMAIEALAKDTNVPDKSGWISVKDRLPPAHGIVIVSINDDRGDTSYRYTDTGWYLSDGKCWIVDNEATISVEAWMPLPKPYKPPEEDV